MVDRHDQRADGTPSDATAGPPPIPESIGTPGLTGVVEEGGRGVRAGPSAAAAVPAEPPLRPRAAEPGVSEVRLGEGEVLVLEPGGGAGPSPDRVAPARRSWKQRLGGRNGLLAGLLVAVLGAALGLVLARRASTGRRRPAAARQDAAGPGDTLRVSVRPSAIAGTRRARARRRTLTQLHALGDEVTLTPVRLAA